MGETQRRVYHSIQATCVELGAEVLALGSVEDHIHLLARLPATLASAELVKRVTGAASHLATHEVAPDRFFKWQGSYAAFSAGRSELDRLCAYIAHQEEHHRLGSLVPDWEEDADESDSWSAQADFAAPQGLPGAISIASSPATASGRSPATRSRRRCRVVGSHQPLGR